MGAACSRRSACSRFPSSLMERPEKVATPRGHRDGRAAAERPAAGVGPDGQAHVVALSPVSTLPLASSTATVTAGVIVAEPAAVLDGPWTKASCGGGRPGVMLKADEVAAVYEGVLDAVRV